MKKTVLLLAIFALSFQFAYSQTANEIISKYETLVMGKFDKSKFDNISLQAVAKSQGMEMPINIIKAGKDKLRLEMFAAGQSIVMVVNGNSGFVVIPGQDVQDVPADVVKKQSEQMGSIGAYTFDREKNTFNLAKEEEGCYVVEESKIKNPKKVNATYYFNKSTGLLDKVKERREGINTISILKDYKTFGELLLPSIIEADANGQKAVIKIKAIDFDFPILPYMFARPN